VERPVVDDRVRPRHWDSFCSGAGFAGSDRNGGRIIIEGADRSQFVILLSQVVVKVLMRGDSKSTRVFLPVGFNCE